MGFLEMPLIRFIISPLAKAALFIQSSEMNPAAGHDGLHKMGGAGLAAAWRDALISWRMIPASGRHRRMLITGNLKPFHRPLRPHQFLIFLRAPLKNSFRKLTKKFFVDTRRQKLRAQLKLREYFDNAVAAEKIESRTKRVF